MKQLPIDQPTFQSSKWQFKSHQGRLHNLFRTFFALTLPMQGNDAMQMLRVAARRKVISLMMSEKVAQQYIKEQSNA